MWDYLVKKILPRRGDVEYGDIHPAHGADPARESAPVKRGRTETRGSETDAGAVAFRRSSGGPRHLRCPVCGTAMELEYIGSVEIDRCPDCRGIFLDRGELQQIKGEDFSRYLKNGPHAPLIYTPHGLTDHVTPHHE